MGWMKDEWNREPERWKARSLPERLDMLRRWHCTGPCGQSSAVLGTRSALDAAIREAIIALQPPDTHTVMESDDGIPRRRFVCPHCGMEQVRAWPHKDGGNVCNGCQREMD